MISHAPNYSHFFLKQYRWLHLSDVVEIIAPYERAIFVLAAALKPERSMHCGEIETLAIWPPEFCTRENEI